MHTVTYVVIGRSGGKGGILRRFEGPECAKLEEGKRLPRSFQAQLYGASDWEVREILSAEHSLQIEGIRLIIQDGDDIPDIILRIYDMGSRHRA